MERCISAFAHSLHSSAPDRPKRVHGCYAHVKRALDIGVAFVAATTTAVPLAITCVAIVVESPGAPMFRQKRIGRNGVPFRMWKLRTMYTDAEKHIERYLNEDQMAQWDRERKVDNDPRVTKVGRFLRESSLDELPQFLNVLVGDMSVVGPRPVTEEEVVWYGDDAPEVLSLRPGITGYWQTFARNDATWESGERQSMELYYVRNMSLGLDTRICLRTFGAILGMTGR